MQLRDVATLVSGTLENADPDAEISGIQTLEAASTREASFLANTRYKQHFHASKAAVILLAHDVITDAQRPVIRVDDPYLAFARLQRHFFPAQTSSGHCHSSAVIDETARLAEDVDVGPQVVIGPNVTIGAGSRIGPACVIEAGVNIGKACILHARCVVASECRIGDRVIIQQGAIIGSDGFGYAWDGKEHLKIPQTGRVVLEDDVEIGANTCIDRGAIGDTVMGRGVKLDNLIQIGHNVKIGAYSIMASQVGISGSTTVGKGCMFGGQAGLAGHIHIGDGCKLAAKTGVMSDLPASGIFAGYPAQPHRVWLRTSALLARLPEMWKLLSGGKKKG